MQEHDAQLELFEAVSVASQQPSRLAPAGPLSLRQDHAVLLMILGLVGSAVVFACGVERGKRVARSERPLLPVSEPAPLAQVAREAEPVVSAPVMAALPAEAPKASTPLPSAVPTKTRAQPAGTSQPAKRAPQQPKRVRREPTASIQNTKVTKRFAVQIVSYAQPQLAQRELQRLHARGEQAFLIKQQGRVVLYVGPFPSKDTAGLKLQLLRQHYRDCFIRVL